MTGMASGCGGDVSLEEDEEGGGLKEKELA